MTWTKSAKKGTFQTRDEWLDVQGEVSPGPDKANFMKVPQSHIAVNSESDSPEEDLAWDALHEKFGQKIIVSTFDWEREVELVEKIAPNVFACGEMTWTVFIDPKELEKIMAEYKKK
ncbi:hypothetical protein [Methylobacter sp.]|uniref:hypothetical protein n=1 Tax=Methylobacter sp. TaxID=2051955 RepID=UPI001224F92C|nr:hypothetical protein [Methylobacter sp.]TAK59486.1 MAG: hypothetical protein EPO18_20195 [Methylobacter sp.]